ncbi:hypothetical protein V8C35DRAFT_324991 [Trichoderma chlorosporum]
MSSVSTRRAPTSRGGLARLVSRFENLGASRPPQGLESAHEAPEQPTSTYKFSDSSMAQEKSKDEAVEASEIPAPPSLAPFSASQATKNRLGSSLGKSQAGVTVTPTSKVGQLISRRGLAVADMRRLFEQRLDDTDTSNVARTATYEPKSVALPSTTNECVDHKAPPLASSSMERSSVINETGIKVRPDLQEERDAASDLVSVRCHVEHPEYLPRPLVSFDSSPQRPMDSKGSAEDSSSTWQRNEPRFKLQGGVFLHKTPSPLRNMVVTEIGTWRPKTGDTAEAVSHSEHGNMGNSEKSLANSLERGKGDDLELLKNLQPGVTLCYPCHDAVLSSIACTGSDAQELRESKSSLLPLSKSVPFQQSKVSNLRKKFDNALPSSPLLQNKAETVETTPSFSSETLLRSIASHLGSVRLASAHGGSQPLHSGNYSSKARRLKETIDLFESLSHQDNREDKLGHTPKISSSLTSPETAVSKSNSDAEKSEKIADGAGDGAGDVTPRPMLLSPVGNEPPRSYSRSPGMDSVSSQASDIKPLLYTTPSMTKTTHQRKRLGMFTRSDWRRKAKASSENGRQKSFPVQRPGYNVDGEGGAGFEQKYREVLSEDTWMDESEASLIDQKPNIPGRHYSLRLLRHRLMSRSHGLFVSQAHCTLEQPQPVRGKELRNIASL